MSQLRYGSRVIQSDAVVNINDAIPEFGGTYINDTNAHTPADEPPATAGPQRGWSVVTVTADAIFDAATLCNITGLAGGGTIPKNTVIKAIFTKIKLTSGAVIANFAAEQPS